MSNLPAQTRKYQDIKGLLEARADEITAVAVHGMDAARLTEVAMLEISKNPGLLECSAVSLYRSLRQVASMGLMLGGGIGHVYLVPYNGECTVIPGYRGLAYLAVKCGAAKSVIGHVVYEHDTFDLIYGRNREATLRPALRDRGEPIGAVAFAELPDGGQRAHWMAREDIVKIQKATVRRSSLMWDTYWEEAWSKTAVLRLVKRLPIGHGDASDRLGIALNADQGGAVIDVEDFTLTAVETPRQVEEKPESKVDEIKKKVALRSSPTDLQPVAEAEASPKGDVIDAEVVGEDERPEAVEPISGPVEVPTPLPAIQPFGERGELEMMTSRLARSDAGNEGPLFRHTVWSVKTRWKVAKVTDLRADELFLLYRELLAIKRGDK